jgi:hypothetical protein
MPNSPIKQFAEDVRPFLRLIEDGANRVAGLPADNRPDKAADPTWTDQQVLDQLKFRIQGTASFIQAVPTPPPVVHSNPPAKTPGK